MILGTLHETIIMKDSSQQYSVQILAFTKDAGIKRIGILHVQQQDHVTFTPCVRGFSKLRHTWHKDGKYTTKNGKEVVQETLYQRIDKLRNTQQMLSAAYPVSSIPALSSEYKHSIDKVRNIFLDITNFEKEIHLSIHLSPYNHLLRTVKMFLGKKDCQTFCMLDIRPYIVLNIF